VSVLSRDFPEASVDRPAEELLKYTNPNLSRETIMGNPTDFETNDASDWESSADLLERTGSEANVDAAGNPVILGRINVSDLNTTIETNQNRVELSTGRAVFLAYSEKTDERTRGVVGQTLSPVQRSAGVLGVATSSEGNPSGIHGASAANDGAGVLGEATADTPADPNQQQNCAGVKGTSRSAKGVGVQAENVGGGLAFKAGSPGQNTFTVESDSANFSNQQTAIMVLVKLSGGNLSLKRVQVGGANSGGQGYRMLRVVN
jgi:hypothetical protein